VPTEPTDAAPRPLLDMTSGYIRRSEHLFPHQADRNPWRVGQNYLVDRWRLGRADVTEEMTMVSWRQLEAGARSPEAALSPESADGSGQAHTASLR
jgi:monooxygenase